MILSVYNCAGHAARITMKTLIIIVLSFLCSASCLAASFDCSHAATPVEQRICTDRQLSALDEELAAGYQQALAAMAGTDRKKLIAEQRAWITSSRSLCDDVPCLRHAYATRIALMRECGHGYCNDKSEDYVVDGETYFLMTMRNANERNPSFNTSLSRRQLPLVAACESLVDISVGTAHGNNSFGGLCKLKSEKETGFFMVCNDEMIGHFQLAKASGSITRHELADFTIKHCFGG